jgi:hypothetical protein
MKRKQALENNRIGRWIIIWVTVFLCCAFGMNAGAANEKILPLGDSITQASSSYNSYRRPLWENLRDAGYVVDFVGSMDKNYENQPPPNPDFDMDHEGHWGWEANELLDYLPGWLSGYTMDIVLLHAGTNDIFRGHTTESTIDELGRIIDTLRNDNPQVTILLGQVIPSSDASLNERISELNSLIPTIISEKNTERSPVILVDHNTGFDPVNDTYDGTHPNGQGEEKMARQWFNALVNILPIPIDNTPPSIIQANAGSGGTEVIVEFSEALSIASAETTANYQIDQGIDVLDARLLDDLKTVTLSVSALAENIVYSLNTTGVLDLADPPNAAENTATFTFTSHRRVTDSLLVLYDFQSGSGDVVYDVSNVGVSMNLSIDVPGSASWIDGGGFSVTAPTLISAPTGNKINEACMATNEITIEAWIRPNNTTQTGPARIVTLSGDASNRNFTLGQRDSKYDIRLRTTETNLNGSSTVVRTGSGTVETSLTHVVYTREASATAKAYVNGVEIASNVISGELANWNEGYRFALANELNDERPWLGDYHLVAVYGRALTEEEVLTNYNAGVESSPANEGPIAGAGSDQTVIDEDNSGGELVTLDASASTDDGTIVSYVWTENGNPVEMGVSPTVELAVGVHAITLTVTDDEGWTATDEVSIVVEGRNLAPVADAGADQTVTDEDNNGVELVTLDGTGSTDDGTLVSYVWGEEGNLRAVGISPVVDLSVGEHVLTLAVTDDQGVGSSDELFVWVLPFSDDTVPSIPGSTRAVFIEETRISLAWEEANDAESGISEYKIYRNGEFHGNTLNTQFLDEGLSSLTEYTYQISAVNGFGLESDPGNPIVIVTEGDDIPPFIDNLSTGSDGMSLDIVFSESVDIVSAENISNYSIGQGIDVTHATLQGDLRTVSLEVSSLAENVIYTLTVIGVLDLADLPNASEDTAAFTFTTQNRVTGDLLALYDFRSNGGGVVYDVSNVGMPMDLTIDDPGSISWIDGGGLSVLSPALISADTGAKIIEACKAGNEITIEAWIRPDNTTQTGPARIVTLSGDAGNRNFTLGQRDSKYDIRLRTTETNLNGSSTVVRTGSGTVETSLTHVVYTREASATARAYVNGVEIASNVISGELANWNEGYRFALANELNDERPWLGDYHLVAVYGRALTEEEVLTNYNAGVEPSPANEGPIAGAGSDQTVIDEDNSGGELVTLDASASTDDGTIVSYVWTESGNQLATGISPAVDLGVGEHVVTLTITDDKGLTGADAVVVMVEPGNQPPVAHAGADQSVADADSSGGELVTLNASGSTDDGTIVSHVWIENGNQVATGISPAVDLGVGEHVLILTVTDDKGLTGTDSVVVIVAPRNQPPVAHAGADQSVADADNSGGEPVALNASGSTDDGAIISHVWTENGNQVAIGMSPVIEFTVGEHNLTLTVTDNQGVKATDTLNIIVLPFLILPPDIEISSIVLKGNVDGGGSPVVSVRISISGATPEDADVLTSNENWAVWEKKVNIPAGKSVISIVSENEAGKTGMSEMHVTIE